MDEKPNTLIVIGATYVSVTALCALFNLLETRKNFQDIEADIQKELALKAGEASIPGRCFYVDQEERLNVSFKNLRSYNKAVWTLKAGASFLMFTAEEYDLGTLPTLKTAPCSELDPQKRYAAKDFNKVAQSLIADLMKKPRTAVAREKTGSSAVIIQIEPAIQ